MVDRRNGKEISSESGVCVGCWKESYALAIKSTEQQITKTAFDLKMMNNNNNNKNQNLNYRRESSENEYKFADV